MDFATACAIVFIGIGGGFVQRVSGFGLGIFVMMFLPHLLPSHTAAAAISSENLFLINLMAKNLKL